MMSAGATGVEEVRHHHALLQSIHHHPYHPSLRASKEEETLMDYASARAGKVCYAC